MLWGVPKAGRHCTDLGGLDAEGLKAAQIPPKSSHFVYLGIKEPANNTAGERDRPPVLTEGKTAPPRTGLVALSIG